MRDMVAIKVIVLLAFNFIPKVTPLTTLKRSRLRDSATFSLMSGDGTSAIKVESSA